MILASAQLSKNAVKNAWLAENLLCKLARPAEKGEVSCFLNKNSTLNSAKSKRPFDCQKVLTSHKFCRAHVPPAQKNCTKRFAFCGWWKAACADLQGRLRKKESCKYSQRFELNFFRKLQCPQAHSGNEDFLCTALHIRLSLMNVYGFFVLKSAQMKHRR